MTPKPTHRLKIEYVDPHTLKPWKGNPRVMSPEDHEKLKTGMRQFGDIVEGGIVDPLIVRRRDNLVIGGHQRLEDVLKLGLPRVPIVRIDISERRMKALNLALNKIHGDWDDDKLASILAELKDLPEANLTGFDEAEIDKIIADADIDNLGMEPSVKTQGLCLVPYLGGKQKLASRLISMMPEHTSYVEVFGGGASVLLNKPRSAIEVYNDLDGWLVNLFEVIRDNPEAFLKKAEFLLYSRELFERWQKEATGGGCPSTPDPVERALRFWYVLRCSFGGQAGKGWAFARAEPRSGALVLQNALTEIRTIHERLVRVEIDHLDFRRLIENRDAPSTFMFLDPPYLDTEQYRVGKFTLDDHKALAELLSKAQGKWLMTVGDHPEIRLLYVDQLKGALDSSLCIEQVIGGERGTYRNLIVSNYPLPQQILQVVEQEA